MAEWSAFQAPEPQGADAMCIDLQPNGTSQAPDGGDVLNVGGFSDQVFEVLSSFAKGTHGTGRWVKEIEAISV